MKENKQMTEQELDQVTGGAAFMKLGDIKGSFTSCLLYTSPSPRDATLSRMPSSA